MKKALLLVSLLSVLIFAGCSNQPEEPESFKLGFIPTESASELTPKAEALTEFLTQEMGMPVEAVVPTNYEALIEALKFNQIDAAFMDSAPSWLANQRAGAEVVLAELKDGAPFYYAEMFVRKDSGIETVQDLKGKRIAFTSMTGSSGFIFPIGEMIKQGVITPETPDFAGLEKALSDTFESYTISGGYSQSLQLLLENKVDVVGGSNFAPSEFLTPEEQSQIKTLVRIGKSPSHPVTVRKGLPESTKQSFIDSMLKLNQTENVQILKDLYGVDGFVEVGTREHLGDLIERFELVTGITEKVLEMKD